MARGKTRQNRASLKIGDETYNVKWSYVTDPETWTKTSGFLWQGLTAATRALILSELSPKIPAYKKWQDATEFIRAFAKMQGQDEVQALNLYLEMTRAKGEELVAELNLDYIFSESDFAPETPALIQGENKEEE